ncbi:MAG: c-type cytochrome biogenesis protein CcmI [Halofilum sp. (in: g-proteobacteria)]|nr:c-type cytochrome biogenesis protein CcmI [Halofilum sp. (in: g-proteobacteria)]
MILFAIVAVAMIALTIAAVLPTLLRRRTRARTYADEDLRAVYRERLAELEAEHARGNLSADGLAEARDELERELLQDTDRAAPAEPAAADPGPARPLGIAVALLVPVVALAMYGLTGRPDLVAGGGSDRLPPDAAQRYAQMPPGQRIPELEAWVERKPEAPRAWRMLGDAYRAQEQFGDAYNAYAARARDRRQRGWLADRMPGRGPAARQRTPLHHRREAPDRRGPGRRPAHADGAAARGPRRPLRGSHRGRSGPLAHARAVPARGQGAAARRSSS